MAYTDKELKKTYSIPVPQYYNPTTGDWEVLYGRNNANRVELYDSNGEPVFSKNVSLLAKTTITWNGTDLTSNVEVPVATGDVHIYINNTADKELTVTLEHEVETDVWVPYIAGDGTAISFKVAATTGKGVYGVFQKFPKYLGGRVVLTAGSAPTASGTTTVQVQGV